MVQIFGPQQNMSDLDRNATNPHEKTTRKGKNRQVVYNFAKTGQKYPDSNLSHSNATKQQIESDRILGGALPRNPEIQQA